MMNAISISKRLYPSHDQLLSRTKGPRNNKSSLENGQNTRWKSLDTRRQFFDELHDKLHMESYEDWYNISLNVIAKHGGRGLLSSCYNDSLMSAIQNVYPEYPWKIWLFNKVPRNFWKSVTNQRQYFNWLGTKLAIQTTESWYHVTKEDIFKFGGAGLLLQYDGSPSKAITSIFPEYPWKVWLFNQVPDGYWDDMKNQREFVSWLGTRLNIASYKDWYRVTKKDFGNNGGYGLLSRKYESSVSKALMTILPEFPWKQWLFYKVPAGYWKDINNQKEYFDWLGQKLDIKTYKDWYKVKETDIENFGGSGLLKTRYNGSPSEALMTLFPHYPWKVWLFENMPKNYWNNKENQRQYFDWLSEQFHIKGLEDWYTVRTEEITRRGGSRLLRVYNSYWAALQTVYPQHQWEFHQQSSQKGEKHLLQVVAHNIFPSSSSSYGSSSPNCTTQQL